MTLEPEIELRPVGFSIACELMSIDLFTEFLESTGSYVISPAQK
jgi:hypothetical protein